MLFLTTVHALELSSRFVVRVVMKALCQSRVRRSDSVYARSERLTLTRGLMRCLWSAVILLPREVASLANRVKTYGLLTSTPSFTVHSSSAETYDDTCCSRSMRRAASTIAWALDPPTPNELMLALRREFWGHGIVALEALTLFPTKSTTNTSIISLSAESILISTIRTYFSGWDWSKLGYQG